MRPMFFFGYGSLVNADTHSHAPCAPARVSGWRRAWVATPQRKLCYLTAVADPSGEMSGAVAPVPDDDWQALDQREEAYERHDATHNVRHDTNAGQIAIYAVPPGNALPPRNDSPILLSYLDTVIAGFLALHGQAGAEAFFAETSGWQAPVLNDRAAPRYPRTTPRKEEVTALVDSHLSALKARIISDQ